MVYRSSTQQAAFQAELDEKSDMIKGLQQTNSNLKEDAETAIQNDEMTSQRLKEVLAVINNTRDELMSFLKQSTRDAQDVPYQATNVQDGTSSLDKQLEMLKVSSSLPS